MKNNSNFVMLHSPTMAKSIKVMPGLGSQASATTFTIRRENSQENDSEGAVRQRGENPTPSWMLFRGLLSCCSRTLL
jgi:hypothetical protein